jgi:hypothetical protein
MSTGPAKGVPPLPPRTLRGTPYPLAVPLHGMTSHMAAESPLPFLVSMVRADTIRCDCVLACLSYVSLFCLLANAKVPGLEHKLHPGAVKYHELNAVPAA